VLEAAAAGFEFVVLPEQSTALQLLAAAGGLATTAPDTTDGRPVVRLLPAPAPAAVLAPNLASRARTGAPPPAGYDGQGLVTVPAAAPSVGAAVGAGPDGRLLVVAAELEDGWQASVAGRPVPVVRAWGHLVAVPLPSAAAEVRVHRSPQTRAALLLGQLAIALFATVAARPATRRRGRPRRRRPPPKRTANATT
jgi:hypothetical protein